MPRLSTVPPLVTLHDGGGSELATRLAERYWGGIDAGMQELLDQWRANGLVRLVLSPAKVTRYAV